MQKFYLLKRFPHSQARKKSDLTEKECDESLSNEDKKKLAFRLFLEISIVTNEFMLFSCIKSEV